MILDYAVTPAACGGWEDVITGLVTGNYDNKL